MQRRQQPRAGLDQHHARAARIGDAKVARDHVDRELLDRPGELHPGRAAADDDEGQERGALGGVGLDLGALEASAAAASG